MTAEVQTNDLKEVANKLIPDSIGKDTENVCQCIYPLHDIFVRKVKIMKKPKFELGKLIAFHGEGSHPEKATGMRQVLKLKELMNMSHQSKNMFEIQTFSGDK